MNFFHSFSFFFSLFLLPFLTSSQYFRVKLMIVGQENVGKSLFIPPFASLTPFLFLPSLIYLPSLSFSSPSASLLRCFREEKEKSKYKLTKKNKNNRGDFGGTSVATDGIDIRDWVEVVEHKGEKVYLSL